MPVTNASPGIYLEEISGGDHSVTGVPTSITAFIGRTARGFVNQATNIASFAEFQTQFGGLDRNSPLSFAVRDFFANGGSQAVVVRLYREAAQDQYLASAQQTADEIINALTQPSVAQALANVNTVVASHSGANEWTQKVAKSLLCAIQDAARKLPTGAPDADSINSLVQTANSEKETSLAPLQPEPTARFAISIGNPATVLELQASSPGQWGANLSISLAVSTSASLAQKFGLETNQLFHLTVLDKSPAGGAETIFNLTFQAGHPRQVDRVLAVESELIRFHDVKVGSDLNQELSSLNDALTSIKPSKESLPSVLLTTAVSDGADLQYDDYCPTDGEINKTGLYALDQVDLFNLLCLPASDDSVDQQSVYQQILSPAADYCVQRRAMLLVDPPTDWVSGGLIAGKLKDNPESAITDKVLVTGTAQRNAAIFFPRLKYTDPLNPGLVGEFPPCGAIAGVFARTDAQRGVWKTAAGLETTLAGVTSLSCTITDADNGLLNPVGINCLRAFPTSGRVIWGGRTLRGSDALNDDYQFIAVRRLALFLEESLYRGLQWAVFEPNGEALWADVRLSVTSFLHDLHRQGAFAGASPAQSYFVKCDAETTSASDINQGIVNVVVGFAPVKPVEFIVITLRQLAGQSSLN
jgi:phage tail sheath protein FI